MASPAMYPLSNVRDPYRPLTEQETNRIILPTDNWTNQYAAIITNSWKQDAEQFLQQSGHLKRWAEADEQLVAYRPQKNWGNSKKPKARIPVFLLFSQMQSILPQILGAMFPLHENIDISPRPGSSYEQAQAALELIMAQLDSLGEQGLTRFRDVALEAFTQAFLYGNGVIEVSWLYKVIEKLVFDVTWEVPRAWQQDPMTGQMIVTPTGPAQRQLRERIQQYILNQPNIHCIDVRDFLVDPQAKSPSIQHPSMRYCGVRSYPTIAELISYRNQPYFDIPDDRTLIDLARQKPIAQSEQAKQWGAASAWGRSWQVANDYTQDPYQQRVECIRWYTNERCIWNLNGLWIAYNRNNICNCKPFLNAYYVPFPNRYHGIALADVTEGDQHMIASMREARLNEISLSIDAPFIRRQGTMVGSPGALALSPEKIIDVNDEPSKALMRLDVQAQTQNLLVEENVVYASSARTSGISDAAVAGVATAGGNSAQRTARGMDVLATAAGTRIQFLVENNQSSLIEPLCTMMHMFNTRFLPRDQMIPILGTDGQPKMLDPYMVLNANPRFTVRSGEKLKQRANLQQILPWWVQTLLNPELLSVMAQNSGMKLKVVNLMNLVMNVIDAPKVDLWEPLSPEDQQRMSQPDPKTILDLQKQRERLQAMAEMAQSQEDKDLLVTLLKLLGTPQNVHSMFGQDDPQQLQAQAALMKARQRPQTPRVQ